MDMRGTRLEGEVGKTASWGALRVLRRGVLLLHFGAGVLEIPPLTEALNDLALYASAQMPLQAPMEVREQAARTAANCPQALTRLRSAL